MTVEPQIQVPKLPDPKSDFIIHTNELRKEFGNFVAVKSVTFEVPRASIFGFIGPSGSGKTTTIRMLTGVLAPTAGELSVLGRKPTEFSQSIRESIGYMPQLFVLYPNLTVWENLNFAASMYGMRFRRRKELDSVLDFVELTEHKGKLARDISGGMQRRLSLAATLVHRPELIFLDEPTAGVDPVLRSKFWDHYRELRANGRTLFVTTQYVSEAAYCDLVAVMAEGNLLIVDTPEGLRHRAFGGDIVDLRTSERVPYQTERLLLDLPFVRDISRRGPSNLRLVVDEASTAVPALMDWCRDQSVQVEGVEEYLPPYDDVFVKLVKGDQSND